MYLSFEPKCRSVGQFAGLSVGPSICHNLHSHIHVPIYALVYTYMYVQDLVFVIFLNGFTANVCNIFILIMRYKTINVVNHLEETISLQYHITIDYITDSNVLEAAFMRGQQYHLHTPEYTNTGDLWIIEDFLVCFYNCKYVSFAPHKIINRPFQ